MLKTWHASAKQKNLAYFAVFALAALGITLLFYRGMGNAITLAAGEHAEDVFFRGGAAQYPLAVSYAWGLYAVSLLFLGAAGYIVIRTGARLEKMFVGIAIPLGMIYLFLMVPMAGPDEQVHYQASYQMSNALLFRWNKMNMGTAAHYDYHALSGHYNPAAGYDRLVREFFMPLNGAKETIIRQYSLNWPLMYLPQSIGIAVGRLLGLNFFPLFFLGRLMNLLFYVFCVYQAIRIMPRYKMLLCMIALMPMCMHQAASYSYDTYINALSFLLTALILKAAWNPDPSEKGTGFLQGWKSERLKGLRKAWRARIGGEGTLSRREIGMILLTAMLWAPAKPVYTPLLLLLLIIPAERFGSVKKKLLISGAVIAVVLAEAIVFQLGAVQSVAASGMSAGDGMNWEGQKNYTLEWILGHPVQAARVFFQSIRQEYRNWLYEGMGSYMAGLTVLIPRRYMKLYLILLLLCILRRTKNASADGSPASLATEDFRTGVWARVILICTAGLSVCLVLLTMMLAWTSDTSAVIQGVQGRYFLPVFMLPFLCLDNRILVLHRNPDKAILVSGLVLHIMTICGVLQATMTV